MEISNIEKSISSGFFGLNSTVCDSDAFVSAEIKKQNRNAAWVLLKSQTCSLFLSVYGCWLRSVETADTWINMEREKEREKERGRENKYQLKRHYFSCHTKNTTLTKLKWQKFYSMVFENCFQRKK